MSTGRYGIIRSNACRSTKTGVRRSRLIIPIEQHRRHMEVASDLAFPLDDAKRSRNLFRRQTGRLGNGLRRHIVIARIYAQVGLIE